MEAGTYIIVWDILDGIFRLEISELEKLDNSVTSYLSSKNDELVTFKMLNGDDFTTKVSSIANWRICTLPGRERDIELEKQHNEETKNIKASIGYFED